MSVILGINAFGHDSAAALVVNGKIAAAVEEERFSGQKHERKFPFESIRFCLERERLNLSELDSIVLADNPKLRLARFYLTQLRVAPRGIKKFLTSFAWQRERLLAKSRIKESLRELAPSRRLPPIRFNRHHRSHAEYGFYSSPFENALVVCLDGVGEFACTSVWTAKSESLICRSYQNYPHSLGMFYSAVTHFLGFRPVFDEYKIMGLAAYGVPRFKDIFRYIIFDRWSAARNRLNMRYFDFEFSDQLFSVDFESLLGGPARNPNEPITDFHTDLAASAQAILEELVLEMLRDWKARYQTENLCLGGGVALNCKLVGRVCESKIFKEVWVPPGAGDAGNAIGAALGEYYRRSDLQNSPVSRQPFDPGLGPVGFSPQCLKEIARSGLKVSRLEKSELIKAIVDQLVNGKIVCICRGGIEFGPRALGNRSILADPRFSWMREKLNFEVKGREGFRPFGAVTFALEVERFPGFSRLGYYMTHLVWPDGDTACRIPAVVHIDGSMRYQLVDMNSNPFLNSVLTQFKSETGVGFILNTSFNLRDRPIVATATEALKAFRELPVDALVMEDYFVEK